MTGDRVPSRARSRRRRFAIVAGVALVFLLIGLRVVPLPDSVASIALPERFWFLLSLVILLGYLGHRTMVSPPARKMMRAPGPPGIPEGRGLDGAPGPQRDPKVSPEAAGDPRRGHREGPPNGGRSRDPGHAESAGRGRRIGRPRVLK